MEIKELERKMDDYLLSIFKCIIINIIFAFITLKMQTFNFFIIAAMIFICSVIATYDNLDKYRLIKSERNDLLMQ